MPVFSVGRLSVTLVELFDTAASFAEALLSCVERMRFAADIDVDQRVFIAVFPFHSLVGSCCRTGQEGIISADVAEHDGMIIRMDILFHFLHLVSSGRNIAAIISKRCGRCKKFQAVKQIFPAQNNKITLPQMK